MEGKCSLEHFHASFGFFLQNPFKGAMMGHQTFPEAGSIHETTLQEQACKTFSLTAVLSLRDRIFKTIASLPLLSAASPLQLMPSRRDVMVLGCDRRARKRESAHPGGEGPPLGVWAPTVTETWSLRTNACYCSHGTLCPKVEFFNAHFSASSSSVRLSFFSFSL